MTRSIEESTLVESIIGVMWLIGEFRGEDGSSYMMVVNRNFIELAVLQLKFRNTPEELLEVSKQTGNQQSTTGYSRMTANLHESLLLDTVYCFALRSDSVQTGLRATGLNEEAQLLSRPPFIDNTPGTLSILHHPNNSDRLTFGKCVLPHRGISCQNPDIR